MYNTRNLPEKQFSSDLRKLLQDINEFKQFQRSGQDSIRMYRIFSGVVDYSKTNITFRNTRFRLTFLPTDGASRGLVYKVEYTYEQGTGNNLNIDIERENVDNEDGSQTWLVSVNGSDLFPNTFVQMKFFFWASGTGTFNTVDL